MSLQWRPDIAAGSLKANRRLFLCYNLCMTTAYITKADGTKEPFKRTKLESSLLRTGADRETTKKIADHIESELGDGMTTAEIYRHAFDLLATQYRSAAHKYSLRRAILELGPAGYPFEKFVADLFRARGFEAVTDQMVRGKCVEHEVDVVAWKEDELVMVEAKFHNEIGLKSDLKVALYVKARTDDLSQSQFDFGGKIRKLTQGVLVTNTKFTEKAIDYAACQGLRLVGWNYPAQGNLEHMIEDASLHPVTSIPNLSDAHRKILIGSGLVLCKDVLAKKDTLASLGIPEDAVKTITSDAETICGTV